LHCRIERDAVAFTIIDSVLSPIRRCVSVRLIRERVRHQPQAAPPSLDCTELRDFCFPAGADNVGFISLSRQELDDQRDNISNFFPATTTLISFVCRMNREPARNPLRSVSNLEFHETTDHVNEVACDSRPKDRSAFRKHRGMRPSSHGGLDEVDAVSSQGSEHCVALNDFSSAIERKSCIAGEVWQMLSISDAGGSQEPALLAAASFPL